MPPLSLDRQSPPDRWRSPFGAEGCSSTPGGCLSPRPCHLSPTRGPRVPATDPLSAGSRSDGSGRQGRSAGCGVREIPPADHVAGVAPRGHREPVVQPERRSPPLRRSAFTRQSVARRIASGLASVGFALAPAHVVARASPASAAAPKSATAAKPAATSRANAWLRPHAVCSRWDMSRTYERPETRPTVFGGRSIADSSQSVACSARESVDGVDRGYVNGVPLRRRSGRARSGCRIRAARRPEPFAR
jgi:hypothetical protein